MTNRHRIAIFNACAFMSQRVRKLFAEEIEIDGQKVSTVLTVNDFSGVPCWQLSARVLNHGKPVNLFVKLPRPTLQKIIETLRQSLECVGAGEIKARNSLTQIDFTKTVSPDELRIMRKL